jgi:3-oxoacyl-[acyl-carrier protein] reductase
MNLDGTVCLVTGAGSGLGFAMTTGLLAAGARVAALDVSEQNLAALRGQCPEHRDFLQTIKCDISSEEDCARSVAEVLTRFGAIGVLVNCAGLGMSHIKRDFLRTPPRFWEITPAKWRDMIEVNINGAFILSRAAAPHMMERGWGRIVNVTTSFSTMIRGGNMPYGASKAALEAMSHAWVEDLAGTGVTVNVLIPGGAAATPMIPEDSPYDRGALVNPAVMKAPICWLASRLSDGVTGRRFIGRLWDPSLPSSEAAERSSSPIAWPDLASNALAGQPRSAGGLKA